MSKEFLSRMKSTRCCGRHGEARKQNRMCPRRVRLTTWRRRNASCVGACHHGSSTSVSPACSVLRCTTSFTAVPKFRSAGEGDEFSEFYATCRSANLNWCKSNRCAAMHCSFLIPIWYSWCRQHVRRRRALPYTRRGRSSPDRARIIQKLLEVLFQTYAKSWEPVYKLDFEFIARRSILSSPTLPLRTKWLW